MRQPAIDAVDDPPEAVGQERLLLWAYRHAVCGFRGLSAMHWRAAAQGLDVHLGREAGRETMAALLWLVQELAAGARRPLAFAPPCRPGTEADETAALALVAACQAGRREEARSRALWLVRSEHLPRVLFCAEALAGAFHRAGHPLAPPPEQGRTGRGHGPRLVASPGAAQLRA